MLHLICRSALAANIALFIAGGGAWAEQPAPVATDAIPGSAIAPGLGLSPQAPPVPPAPGGRAPSFGAPTEKGAPQFHLGGRIFGFQAVGIGSKPSNPPEGYSGTALHVPMLSNGKIPFWGGAGFTLNADYGTPTLRAYVTYYFRLNGEQYQSYYNPQQGPGFGVAYLLLTPDPIGKLRLQFKAGSFMEIYGGPGQWGWGIFGPMLGLKGYGETASADYDLTRDVHVTLTHGLLVNPGVPENWSRGDYNAWIETGVSNWVHHAHLGIAYKQYNVKLHYASDYGTDDRRTSCTNLKGPPHDGRMDTYLAEAHWQENPWGQVGLTAGLYNFDWAASVSNGVWWAVDWTQGTREMINKYLGQNSNGNGKVAVIGAEYNFSIASILWHPRSFDSRAPDVRVSLAAMITRTLATEDSAYKNAMGYFFGVETEYRMTSKLSLTFQAYGESRDANISGLDQPIPPPDPSGANVCYLGTPNHVVIRQRWSVYSVNPGIAYHADWLSLDRIQLIYGRRFYSAAADNNSGLPYDKHMIVLGGYVTF